MSSSPWRRVCGGRLKAASSSSAWAQPSAVTWMMNSEGHLDSCVKTFHNTLSPQQCEQRSSSLSSVWQSVFCSLRQTVRSLQLKADQTMSETLVLSNVSKVIPMSLWCQFFNSMTLKSWAASEFPPLTQFFLVITYRRLHRGSNCPQAPGRVLSLDSSFRKCLCFHSWSHAQSPARPLHHGLFVSGSVQRVYRHSLLILCRVGRQGDLKPHFLVCGLPGLEEVHVIAHRYLGNTNVC